MDAGMIQLSSSSKAALRFAWAAAQERADQDPSGALVNPWDLLIGIVLSHPGTSEPELTFRHFGLFVGQALPEDYPRLTPEALNQRLAATPPTGDPPLSDETRSIVDRAIEARRPDPGTTVTELPWLWWAFLSGSTPASSRVQNLLTRRGVDATALTSTTLSWLNSTTGEPSSQSASQSTEQSTVQPSGSSYAELLQSFPVTPGVPVDVINYMPDQTLRADRSTNAVVPDDYVGISAEVDAFAYLLASCSLDPPLAVGLFGDWGSGKSYFLDGIRRRIDQLTASDAVSTRPQHEAPFWKSIVHVEFNAWHYVEGDLWSSLVDHIITQLNLASENLTDDIVVRRQHYYLGQLETTSTALTRLQGERDAIVAERAKREKNLDALEKEHTEAIAKLQEVADEKVVEKLVSTSSTDVVDAVGSIQLNVGDGKGLRLREALGELEVARAELGRGRALLLPFLENRRWRWYLFLGLVATVIVPLVIERLSGSATGSAFGGLASFVVTGATALGVASRWVGARLDQVEQARQAVNREIADAEEAWRERLNQARSEVTASARQLENVKRREEELQAKMLEIDTALKKQPTELLYEFLHERFTSGYYRERLGVPAIVRRDFKGLAELIQHQNNYLLAPPAQQEVIKKQAQSADLELLPAEDKRIINRIILYIDDLDRCPDDKVIEVLQAVHLLLAFPLFVVVVAVDSRWLAHALRSRFPALADGASANGDAVARPNDYLEKIFQVPFWVRPLDDDGRGRIVRGLLGRHVRHDAVDTTNRNQDTRYVGPREAQALHETIDPRNGPPLLDAAALTVSRTELAFLDSLGPLMGDTPRSVKRFVNVYQLIKILRRGRTPVMTGSPSDEEVAAFLLAVAEGLPNLGSRIFDKSADAPGNKTLWMVLEDPSLGACLSELKRLKAWLDSRETWKNLSMGDVAVLAAEVKRFVFGVIPRGA
jgi:hypothetical protein